MPLKRSTHAGAPLLVGVRATTSVSVRERKRWPERLELARAAPEVVDLAVVGDDQSAVGGRHRLMRRAGERSMIARRRLAEADRAVDVADPRRPGPRWAMASLMRSSSSGSDTGSPRAVEHAGDAAHELRPPRRRRSELRRRRAPGRRRSSAGYSGSAKRQALGDGARFGKSAGAQAVLARVVAGRDRRVGALAGRDAALLEPRHQRVAPLVQRVARCRASAPPGGTGRRRPGSRGRSPRASTGVRSHVDVGERLVVERGQPRALVEDPVARGPSGRSRARPGCRSSGS